jgi:hypothetical protein
MGICGPTGEPNEQRIERTAAPPIPAVETGGAARLTCGPSVF